jgi:glutamate racemase
MLPETKNPHLQLKCTQPVGILDSGVGGLSVLQEILKLLPNENLLYYADSGNCPYGVRPQEEIRALTKRVAGFLLTQGAKSLVIACNTASTASVAYLRQLYPLIPIVGMVPAVKPAASLTRSGIVAVLATEATGKAPVLHEVIDRFAGNSTMLICAPPGLVELVEAGKTDTPETAELLQQYLTPLITQGADTLVLGCTHFPFLRELIKRLFGEKLTVVDSGEAVARQTRKVLEMDELLNPQNEPGSVRYFTSGNPAQVAAVIQRLLKLEQPPEVIEA